MLFNEIYGCYYNAVAKILSCAVSGTLTDSKIYDIVRDYAFAESIVTIPSALKNQKWPFLLKDNSTPLKSIPTMPLTDIQKQWLKSLLADPRIMLFEPSVQGLEDVKPLYSPDFFVYFDSYEDSDPYDSPDYIKIFKTTLSALKEKRMLKLEFTSGKGIKNTWLCMPLKLEYSRKDDKFRLLADCGSSTVTINMSRITLCEIQEDTVIDESAQSVHMQKTKILVLELTDTKNALERLLIQFSHMEKETVRLADNRYRVSIKYLSEDEHEILIQLLSFGQNIKVTEPSSLASLIKYRIHSQKNLLKNV